MLAIFVLLGMAGWVVVSTSPTDASAGANNLAAPLASPLPTPFTVTRLFAPLSGAAIGGVAPAGGGIYASATTSGFSLETAGPALYVLVRNVNLPVGTVLDVMVGAANVGQITLRTTGQGELHLEGSGVPAVAAGTTLAVKNGAATILAGVFSATPPPFPTPSPRPSVTPFPTPSPRPSVTPFPTPSPRPSVTPSPRPSPTPLPSPGVCSLRLSSDAYAVNENAGAVVVTVQRACTTAGASWVRYGTLDGTASGRSDYTRTAGLLAFASGETSKTFRVMITNDNIPERAETFLVYLEFALGGTLEAPRRAVVTINDDDPTPAASNPLDEANFFVNQQYADFLSREPDAGGLAYWSGQITGCGAEARCVSRQRIGVSAAFFVENEFQESGSFVYRLYQASFGRQPDFAEFEPDRALIVGGDDLEQNKLDFADEWVTRPAFQAEYPDAWIPEQFVNHLFDQAGLTGYADERQAAVDALHAGATRADVVRGVIEIEGFKQREYNRAFVLMQYFGYLRRDADPDGYQFWLNLLNQQPGNAHGMVCAFVTSEEMQLRFSTMVTRTNAECAGQP
jgi:hypothetical protein